MRSPTVRLTLCVMAWLAIGASAFFLIRSDKNIAQLRAAVRAFDLRAREVAQALADLRVAQEAYVAEGQNVALWMPKVNATSEAVGEAIASLRRSATTEGARAALDNAENSVAEFGAIDKRARDYIKSGQQLRAGDVIFAEGGEAAVRTARQVESAQLEEQVALDAAEARVHTQQALVLGAAASLAALIVLLLVPLERAESATAVGVDGAPADLALGVADPADPLPDLSLRLKPESPPPTASRPSSPALRTAAELCTDFGRLRDLGDLQALLGRAAEVMDASGLVVWFGSTAGADLRPVLAHGYPPHTFARMPNVPRACNNAAAAAYRTGRLQIVLSRPGSSSGALVAPIHSSGGCVGALSAEIRSGGETSESVQALASIFAAQLAPILASAAAADVTGDTRAAASS